jgi:hypothetical protein
MEEHKTKRNLSQDKLVMIFIRRFFSFHLGRMTYHVWMPLRVQRQVIQGTFEDFVFVDSEDWQYVPQSIKSEKQ